MKTGQPERGSFVLKRVDEVDLAHFVGVVELPYQIVEFVVGDLAVGVGICLLHQLQPHFLLYLLAVAQRVPQLAYLDLPAPVLVEYLEHLADVDLPDQKETVGAVGEELGKAQFSLPQSHHHVPSALLGEFVLLLPQQLHEPGHEVGLVQLPLTPSVDLHEDRHYLLFFVE